MDVEQAVSLSSEIGTWLNGQNPVLSLADDSPPAAREAFLQALGERGLLEKMDSGYRESLFDRFRILDGAAEQDKTAAEKVQGYWILEIGELAGMKKADLDKVANVIAIDIEQLAKDNGVPRSANVILLGAAQKALGIDYEKIEDAIRRVFSRKGEMVVDANIKALAIGKEAQK